MSSSLDTFRQVHETSINVTNVPVLCPLTKWSYNISSKYLQERGLLIKKQEKKKHVADGERGIPTYLQNVW